MLFAALPRLLVVLRVEAVLDAIVGVVLIHRDDSAVVVAVVVHSVLDAIVINVVIDVVAFAIVVVIVIIALDAGLFLGARQADSAYALEHQHTRVTNGVEERADARAQIWSNSERHERVVAVAVGDRFGEWSVSIVDALALHNLRLRRR